MDAREVAARRMHNQHLWGKPRKTAEDVVHRLVAMQAQEFVPAKWSVAQRSEGTTDAMMDEAFAAGRILRTHVVRPTWHFVLPKDIRWLLDVTGPRVHALNASYYRKFGVDDEVFAKCRRVLTKALQGGNQLTRKELAARLARNGVEASGLHLGYILMRAELDAVICSGALRGRQQTYALFDERVQDTKTLSRAAGLAELARRYFVSRGPATLKDFARWSSLTTADAKAGLAAAESDLERAESGGRVYWYAAGTIASPPASPVVDLVQGYDECVMSYSESKDVLHPPGSGGADPYQAAYLHAILLDGQVIGHWKHVLRSREVVVETHFYQPPDAARRAAMDAAVQRLGRYFGVAASWR